MPRLTDKQARFVAEYLVDSNATQAAIRAGYSEKTAHSCGPRLLENAGVAEAIEAKRGKVLKKLELTAEKVLSDIYRLARKAERVGDLGVSMRGRELLGKHFKLFTEKVEATGADGGPLQIVIKSYADEGEP